MAEPDEPRLRERALAQLGDFADLAGKRLLLVVENFNMLLGDQLDDAEAWAIRHTLLNEKRIMLLASATSWIDHSQNSGKAMFEAFKHHILKPLNHDQCRRLWNSQTGKAPSPQRIRPIQILTGGSPRLLTIVASFALDRSLKQLMNELMQLIDDHTDYFKSRLDNMAAVERKVYLALAEIWDPAPASQVAKQARLSVNKASSLLNRLVSRGRVTITKKEGRAKWYQISERLYNIYYLMRRRGAPAQRVQGFVNFMVSFYGPEEPWSATVAIVQDASCLDVNDSKPHYMTNGAISEKNDTALSRVRQILGEEKVVQREVEDIINVIIKIAAAGMCREVLGLVQRAPGRKFLEPLCVGLRLYLGEKVNVATEILEVGKDVCTRIEEEKLALTVGNR